jgi:hypothetical protein
VRVSLPDGRVIVHDGHVYAVDKRSEIIGNHIDFFTGITTSNPAPRLITSTPTHRFDAYVVRDISIVS